MDEELPYSRPAKPKRTRPRLDRGWTVGLVAGGVVVVLVLALGVRMVVVRAMCEQSPIRLRVAAALDVAPAVERIGQYFNDLNRAVDGHCAQVQVTEDPPDQAAAQLSGMTTIPGQTPIDAWIPDSSLWTDLVRTSPRGAAAVHPTGVSVARSPLVIAAPKNAAAAVSGSPHDIGWQTLMPQDGGMPAAGGLQVELPDPSHSSAGLATLVEIRRLLGDQPTGRDQLTNFVHNVAPTNSLDNTQGLTAFAELAQPPWNLHPVTVTTEQAVESYNQSGPRVPLAAFYPSQEYDLDFPFVLTTSSPLKVKAARQFEQILGSSFAATYVRAGGFRSADRQADQAGGQFGIVGNLQPAVALAASGEASTALQAWQRLSLGSRDLVLTDLSGAVNEPLADGETIISTFRQATLLGLSLFPDNTQIGGWEYSYRMTGSLPYRVAMPLGPLTDQVGLVTRRQALQQLVATTPASPDAPAALFSAILDGFEWMNAHYQPGHVNAIIVLGSGTHDAPGDLSLSQILSVLRKDYDPQRPIEIITVSAGSGADEAALQQITAVTHGQSYMVQQPSDIGHVFFDAIARRICNPNCGIG